MTKKKKYICIYNIKTIKKNWAFSTVIIYKNQISNKSIGKTYRQGHTWWNCMFETTCESQLNQVLKCLTCVINNLNLFMYKCLMVFIK